MAKLTSPPSLQHLVRTWRDSPERTRKVLINNARSRPIFSYAPLHVAIREMLVLGVPYHQVVEFVRRAEKRADFAIILLEILPIIRRHLDGVSPDFFQDVAPRSYALAPISSSRSSRRSYTASVGSSLCHGASSGAKVPWPESRCHCS